MGYADDICLISEIIKKAQALQTRLELKCAEVGLRLNRKKTKVTAITSPRTPALSNNIGELAVKEVTWVHGLHHMG